MSTMIGMGNAGELAQDVVSGRRGKYASSAYVWFGVFRRARARVCEYVGSMFAGLFSVVCIFA